MSNQDTSPSAEKKKSRFSYSLIILIASFFIVLILGGIVNTFGVFLKPLLNEFGWSRSAISSAFFLNMILFGISGIVAGKISDRFSPRVSLMIGGFLTGLGYLLMSQVSAIWQIYLFYGIIASIGTGFIPIPLLSLVARWFVKGRGLASGIVVAGSGLGMAIVPPLANLFISNYSWRTAYLVLGTVSLVVIIAFAQLLRRAPGQSPSADQEDGKTDNSNLQTQGLTLREAAGTTSLWIILVIGFFFFFGIQTILVHIPAHATDIGFSSATAASILSVIGFVNVGSTLAGGILGDKIGTRKTLIIIFILISLSFVGFELSGQLWMLYLCAVIFGLGFGAFAAAQSPLVAEFFGLKSHGVIFSLFMFSQNLGGASGPLVAGILFDVSGSYQSTFILCGILSIVGLALSILLKPVRKTLNQTTSPL